MTNNYYDKDKHNYMQYSNDRFADYIYLLIFDDSFLNYDRAIELGSGMGRFSAPIIKSFSDTTIVEPVEAYADIVKKKFSEYDVRIINSKAESFLSNQINDKPSLVFCFHLMHHLKYEQRAAIYQFIKETGSKGVLVEPNPFNPFVFLQILCHPDMSIDEEKRYLALTHGRYKEEIESNGLTIKSFKRFCFLPPVVINFLLKKLSYHFISFFELLNKFFPFMSSYQLIVFE